MAPHAALSDGGTVWDAIVGMGDMPVALVLLIPRLAFSYFIVGLAMISRACARLIGATSTFQGKANLRILIVTDYMPPQTHGIAIRFRQYIDYLRKEGHEVHVFCTNTVKERETSFDHPNLPSITNPYNTKNKMAYNAGVKLSWFLSGKQWDIIHLVCPSNIPWGVLPVAAWRRIPIYVSHHVDMEYYIFEYVKAKPAAYFGSIMYWILTKAPCQLLAHANAAPTIRFLDGHIRPWSGSWAGERFRIPSGVAVERFKVNSETQLLTERAALLARCGYASGGLLEP